MRAVDVCQRQTNARELYSLADGGKEGATYWVERSTAVATDVLLDLLVSDLQHRVVVGKSVSTRADKLGIRWGEVGLMVRTLSGSASPM